MAPLQDLADELLSEILSYLVSDKSLLCNVAIQSRRLSELVRPFLAREVRFVTRPPSKAFRLFVRSACESTIFASMVREVLLNWDQGTSTTHDLMNKLLTRLPQLRSLTLQACWDKPPWAHQYLEKNPMEFLTVLDLNIQDITIAEVVKYLFIKRLEHMSISWINKPKIPKLPKSFSYGASNISSLKLGSGFHLPEDVLHEILKYPRSLKTLVTNLPGRDVPNDYFTAGSAVTTPLSPAGVANALEPTKLSLRELRLVDEDCEWPSQDRGRTDLSNFTALRKLQIASRCYFLPGISARDSIVHLLPASLEEIEIVYDLRSGISPQPNQNGPTHGISNASGEMTLDCNWMMYLATAKTNHTLPALQKVTLTERAWNKWSRGHRACINAGWNTPSVITRAFCDAGIQFTATARVANTRPIQSSFYVDTGGVNYAQNHEYHIMYQRDPPVLAAQDEASS